MELSGISQVLQRIAEIEKKVGMQRTAPAPGFSQQLQQAMKNGGATAAQTAASGGGAAKSKTAAASAAAPGDVNNFIQTAAKKYNVDPRLVSAVAEAESGFQQEAVSGAGAVGVMQLMPDTAAWIAKQLDDQDFSLERLHEPDMNIRYGTWYLSSLRDELIDIIQEY